MNTGQEEMPGEFDLRKFARPSPWMTCTDLNERIQPNGAVLSDDELIRQRDPHYWERDDPRADKELGFWSTDMRSLERLYGKAFVRPEYFEDEYLQGSRCKTAQAEGIAPPSDAFMFDDHYENDPIVDFLFEDGTPRKPRRIGQFLDLEGQIETDPDGSFTGKHISDDLRCCNSMNLLREPWDTKSLMEGMEIPIGLSLRAVEEHINIHPIVKATIEDTGHDPDPIVCHKPEELLELRLQAACEGLIEKLDGTFEWDNADSIRRKINALVAEGADINWSDDWGWTPIHCAVANGNYPAVALLCEYGADLEITSRPRSWTVLFRAAHRGYLEILETLLVHGANPWHIDDANFTALEVAALYNSTNCIPLLRNFMGEEANNIDLDQYMQETYPTPLGPGPDISQPEAEGWPLRSFEYVLRKEDKGKYGRWTDKNATEEAKEDEEILRMRQENGTCIWVENPLDVELPYPEIKKIYPDNNNNRLLVNWTAYDEYVDGIDHHLNDPTLTPQAQYLHRLTHQGKIDWFDFSVFKPHPDKHTKTEVMFNKRILDPRTDFSSILQLNFGFEPGEQPPRKLWRGFPEGRHWPFFILYRNDPGTVLNLYNWDRKEGVNWEKIDQERWTEEEEVEEAGNCPRPALYLDYVRHTKEYIDMIIDQGKDIPQGRGIIVDVFGPDGLSCEVEWDRTRPNGEFAGKRTRCSVGAGGVYSLELARFGATAEEDFCVVKLEELRFLDKLEENYQGDDAMEEHRRLMVIKERMGQYMEQMGKAMGKDVEITPDNCWLFQGTTDAYVTSRNDPSGAIGEEEEEEEEENRDHYEDEDELKKLLKTQQGGGEKREKRQKLEEGESERRKKKRY